MIRVWESKRQEEIVDAYCATKRGTGMQSKAQPQKSNAEKNKVRREKGWKKHKTTDWGERERERIGQKYHN